jgi:hypothetical protein
MNFDALADELDRQEAARIDAARPPRLEVFCSMTPGAFRDEIAAMMEPLNHTVATITPWIVTVKEGRKFVTACANPADPTLIKTPAIRRLHDAVIAASAFRGIYVTPRGFTPEAGYYADNAPVDLVDGPRLIKSTRHRLRTKPSPSRPNSQPVMANRTASTMRGPSNFAGKGERACARKSYKAGKTGSSAPRFAAPAASLTRPAPP